MRTRNHIGYGFVISVLVVVLATATLMQIGGTSRSVSAAASSIVSGQTATLLPDASWLLLGGQTESGPTAQALVKYAERGAMKPLPNGMAYPRTGHSATLLPNGLVLVLGGIGSDGRVVSHAELFDPKTSNFQILEPKASPSPRAFHTATLTTTGVIAIVGGVSDKGETLDRVELWDTKTNSAVSSSAELKTPRREHTSRLLADGRVFIWGGKDANGSQLDYGELFDPDLLNSNVSDNSIVSSSQDGLPPRVAVSIPEDGANEIPLDAVIALRFSKPVRVDTFDSASVTLADASDRSIVISVVPTEQGMLGFITPKFTLSPNSAYTLSIDGVHDPSGLLLPKTIVSFTTIDNSDDGDWIPEGNNWTTGRSDSRWQSLPALQAGPGVTALAGQALKLNGKPLANVTVEIGGQSTRTDKTGRFILAGIMAGHCEMWIDGQSANLQYNTYGVFEVGVDITANQTNVLPYTIWMPRLDMEHAVNIPTALSNETTITTPRLPGLELKIPAGTRITDRHGSPVRQVSITPVPLDRPPFPLPKGVEVPIYFTIQPGGAYLEGRSATGLKGARLIYPNTYNKPVGTRFDFWNYDAEAKGWYIYGGGEVSADKQHVIPDPVVVIYEFTGAMVANPSFAPQEGPPPGDNCDPTKTDPMQRCKNCSQDGDPVNLATGLFVLTSADLFLADALGGEGCSGGINLRRTYRPRDSASRAFGIGTSHTYELFLIGNQNPYTYQELILPDGGRIHYDRISAGTSWADAVYKHTATPTAFYGSTISWNGNGWDLKFTNGTLYKFPESCCVSRAQQAALISVRDRYGNTVSLTRDSMGNLTQITSPSGRWIKLAYDSSNRITQAQDNIGRVVTYLYDTTGRLWKVTDPNGGVTEYTYDTSHRMLTIKDPRNIVYLANEYDANGRVVKQTQADATTYQFAYTVDGNGKIVQTDIIDPRANTRRVTFNSIGYILTDTSALGKPEQQTTSYVRQSGTNLILSETDALGRLKTYSYNTMGKLISITRLAGTPQAQTTLFTYEPNFSLIASETDPLGHSSSYTYDSKGSLVTVTDSLGNQTTFTDNLAGQQLSITNAVGQTTQFTYDGGDLITVVDPLGRTTRRFNDSAGRLVSNTNAVGQTSRYEYDNFDRLTRSVDPLGAATSYTYDSNGNLLSVVDARGATTTYTYDSRNRVATRRDPLLQAESYEYDSAGNLKIFTDRRGEIATSSYDALNRKIFAGFGTVVQGGQTTYESTIAYSYDAGNRLTQAIDSVSGTVAHVYDDFNRLTVETTSQGSVNYSYDAAGRRTSMTVDGQPSVTYTYDDGNRLTQIAQGASTVGFTYDAANRRTNLNLPNGIITEYSYDSASELTAIAYRLGSTVIGDLIYEYDPAGRRNRIGGSFARTALPQAISSATYDASNQLIHWGASNLAYDANGNVSSDGVNTYNWDARNRMVSITGGSPTTFQYDAFNRRISSGSTQYVYDRLNPVQELVGGLPAANLLTGLALDDVYSRTDPSGARTLLRDALGSTVGLTDSAGNLPTQYTYEPFGQATSTGATSSNPFQYAARENDGTGLFYYRARYYSPTLHRFISQDPIGFKGGINAYSYVANNPIAFTDPLGLENKEKECKFKECLTQCLQQTLAGNTSQLVDNLLFTLKYGVPFSVGLCGLIALSEPWLAPGFPECAFYLSINTVGNLAIMAVGKWNIDNMFVTIGCVRSCANNVYGSGR